MDEKNRVSSISQAQSIADMAAFWDEHDATEFEDQTHEVDMAFDLAVHHHCVAIDPALLQKLQQTAKYVPQIRRCGTEPYAKLGQ